MMISDATPDDVAYVAMRMRERDVDEFMAISWADNREELAHGLIRQYGNDEEAIVAKSHAGEPICVGAPIQARPNVITLLFFATDKFPSIAAPVTSFITKRLFPPLVEAGVHRIECASHAAYVDAHRWIQLLGLSYESAMPGYGKNGELFYQFAWVKDADKAS